MTQGKSAQDVAAYYLIRQVKWAHRPDVATLILEQIDPKLVAQYDALVAQANEIFGDGLKERSQAEKIEALLLQIYDLIDGSR